MKRLYIKPLMEEHTIASHGVLMTSGTTQSVYTDDPQQPGNALAPLMDDF